MALSISAPISIAKQKEEKKPETFEDFWKQEAEKIRNEKRSNNNTFACDAKTKNFNLQ